MCGIAGLYAAASPPAASQAVARAMLDAIVHRGPDSEGVWTDAEAVDSPLNTRRLQPFPFNHPPVYAPSTLAPGSTPSHLDQGFTSQLMTPFVVNGLRTLGLARPMLSALGWRSGPAPLPAYAVPYGGQWYDPDRSGH